MSTTSDRIQNVFMARETKQRQINVKTIYFYPHSRSNTDVSHFITNPCDVTVYRKVIHWQLIIVVFGANTSGDERSKNRRIDEGIG